MGALYYLHGNTPSTAFFENLQREFSLYIRSSEMTLKSHNAMQHFN
jgi:hypothetical protein